MDGTETTELEQGQESQPDQPTESVATEEQPKEAPDPRLEELAILRTATQRMLDREEFLQGRVNELEGKLNAPPPEEEKPLPNKEEAPIDYLEAKIDRAISKLASRLETQVAPLQEGIRASQHQQMYAAEATKLIAKYPQLDAKFFADLYPQVGGPKLDVKSLEMAALTAYGLQTLTSKPTPKPAAKDESEEEGRTLPPRSPNSTPPSGKPKGRGALTEGERAAMETMRLDPKKPADVDKFRSYIESDTRVIDMGY